MNKKNVIFNKAFEDVLGLEGGYVNNPHDPGGETKWGISKKRYPKEDIKNLSVERAKALYKRDYWDIL
jgi:lysozyme family protein